MNPNWLPILIAVGLLALSALAVWLLAGSERLTSVLRQAERDRIKDLENRNSEDKK